MKQTVNKQLGSAHIVIIILIVVAILGALGFVAWKYVTKENTDALDTSLTDTAPTGPKNTTAEETPLVGKHLMTSDNLGVVYKVPYTWTGGDFGGGDTLSESESTTLTAPDGFTIHMTISRLTRGWTRDDLTLNVLEVQKTTGTELTWVVVDGDDSKTPTSLQIVNGKDIPAVGDKKLNGASIYKIGTADGQDVYLEIYGGYDKKMSLEAFNNTEATKQAKAVYESLYVGME